MFHNLQGHSCGPLSQKCFRFWLHIHGIVKNALKWNIYCILRLQYTEDGQSKVVLQLGGEKKWNRALNFQKFQSTLIILQWNTQSISGDSYRHSLNNWVFVEMTARLGKKKDRWFHLRKINPNGAAYIQPAAK